MELKGKSFGAIKAVLLRLVDEGYRPEWTQVAMKKSDRERIRKYAKSRRLPIVDAISSLCDKARLPKVSDKVKEGSLASLVGSIVDGCGGETKEKIKSRIRNGEFDEYINLWLSAR